MADYVAVPRRNAIPLPDGLAPLDASLLGTAWLTAYRCLFTKSRLNPVTLCWYRALAAVCRPRSYRWGRLRGSRSG